MIFGGGKKKFTKVFYATDVHGSAHVFKKFINATKHYQAEVLILGGDVTGKRVIPIVTKKDGTYTTEFMDLIYNLNTKEEIAEMDNKITESGSYPYYCDEAEFKGLQADPKKVDKVFFDLMLKRMHGWIAFAEEKLAGTGTKCYITGGNDDDQRIIDLLEDTESIKNPDNEVVYIDETHEMASIGWSNRTPWNTPRECTEEELHDRIEKLVAKVKDMQNCIFNFHVPPVDTGLDTCPKLDESVYPPKPLTQGGQVVMFGAGSSSVREAIEKYQPLVGLHGHIHESRGMYKIGNTLCFNPGSEYGEGILRGIIVNLGDKKIVSYQPTSG